MPSSGGQGTARPTSPPGGGQGTARPSFTIPISLFIIMGGYYCTVLKKAHPYGTDDFFAEKRGFYPA
jgi:hypothetical protein